MQSIIDFYMNIFALLLSFGKTVRNWILKTIRQRLEGAATPDGQV